MKITRRESLMLGLGAAVAAMVPTGVFAASFDEAVAAFTGGASASEGGVVLTAPEIAENGNTVPIEVNAPGAVAIAVFAEKNPSPEVASFKFGPLSGSQRAAIRMRLAGTQKIVVVAQMADGSFVSTSQEVKVTIGGCGG